MGDGEVVHVRGRAHLARVVDGAGARLVVIDWFAPWCGPCQRIKPEYERLARLYPQAILVSVDTEDPANKVDGLAAAFSIRAFPTFTFHLNAQEVERFSGANPDKLHDHITRLLVRAEDMELTNKLKTSSMKDGQGQTVGGADDADAPLDESALLAKLDAAEKEDPEPEGGEEPPLTVKAKRITGDVTAVQVAAKASAQHLRRKLARELKADYDSIRLIFRGKILVDGNALASYGITESDLTVHVAVSGVSKGRPAAAPSPVAAPGAGSDVAPARPAVAKLRAALTSLAQNNNRESARGAVQVMQLYVRNVVSHPDEVKYRSIRQANAKFASKVAVCKGWLECMRAIGFDCKDRDGETYLVLRADMAQADLEACRDELVRFAETLAPAGVPAAAPSAAPAPPTANPFAGLGRPAGNFANMFAAQQAMAAGGGGLAPPSMNGMPGVSPQMLAALQSNPALQQATAEMTSRLMQNPQLMESLTRAMATGQDPMAAMMSDPSLMQSMMSVMSNPEVAQSMMGSMGGLFGGAPAPGTSPFAAFGFPPPAQQQQQQQQQQPQQPPQQTSAATQQSQSQGDEEEDNLDDLDDIYAE